MKNIGFHILRLLQTPGIGAVRVRAVLDLAKHYQIDLGEILTHPDILHKVLTETQVNDLLSNHKSVLEVWDHLQRMNIALLATSHDCYPDCLHILLGKKAPPLLAVLGNPSLLSKPSVSFCGSRKASEKGLATAHDCATQLASEGLNIVSGYAAGVDMETHKAALESGGTTTLILAEGILNFKLKRELNQLWDLQRVAVVSEFLPKIKWNARNAMQRNYTICALSQALILIEARSTGGSIEAGRACLKMGLPLFAAVYEGMPETATGNQELLSQGAQKLMKNRKTNRANVESVLAVFRTDNTRENRVKKLKEQQKSEEYQLALFE